MRKWQGKREITAWDFLQRMVFPHGHNVVGRSLAYGKCDGRGRMQILH